MGDGSVNPFDLAVLCIMGFSVAIATARGFAREVFSLATTLAALSVAWLYTDAAAAYARTYIPNDTAARVSGFIALFFLVRIGLRLALRPFARYIARSQRLMNRFAGAGFGFVRGAAVAAVMYLVATAIVPSHAMPQAFQEAESRPFVIASADALKALLPKETMQLQTASRNSLNQAVQDGRIYLAGMHELPADVLTPEMLASATERLGNLSPEELEALQNTVRERSGALHADRTDSPR